jgi:hypothetical protein
MKLAVDWQRPIPLQSGVREGLIYTVDLDKIEPVPGIYIFARRWGRSFEALYVGQSQRLRYRIRGHLNNLRLMNHIKAAKTGRRFVIIGESVTRRGPRLPKVLKLLERAYLQHYLAEGHDLVNKQGTKIRRHEIISSGRIPKAFVPSQIYLERSKGE